MTGRGNYNGLKGVGGGYSVGGNGIFGTGGVGVTVGAGSRNQYLPPGGGYGKWLQRATSTSFSLPCTQQYLIYTYCIYSNIFSEFYFAFCHSLCIIYI